MLSKGQSQFSEKDFRGWLLSSHELFEIFESRADAYWISRKWIFEWLQNEHFSVSDEDRIRLDNLIHNFDYAVFGIRNILPYDPSFRKIVKTDLGRGINKNIGLGVSPCLFTWNFQRFKTYFSKVPSFNLTTYFEEMGDFLINEIDDIRDFTEKRIFCSDDIDKDATRLLYEKINKKFKEISGINYPSCNPPTQIQYPTTPIKSWEPQAPHLGPGIGINGRPYPFPDTWP